MWKLNPVIWRDIIEVNMKEWGIPAISVNTLLLKQVIWRSSYDLWSDIQTNLQREITIILYIDDNKMTFKIAK